MSVASAVVDALLDIAEQQLTGCGRPPEIRSMYHGKMPAMCCTEGGALTGRFNRIFYADSTPTPTAPKWHTVGTPALSITLRLDRCWPIVADLAAWLATDFDARAKAFLDDALAVELALHAAACDGTLADLTGCHNISVGEATPVPVDGGCAAIEWAVVASLRTSLSDQCLEGLP